MYLPFLTLCLSELLGHGVLHHLGVLLIQAVGAGLAGVLLQVDLADELHIGRPLRTGMGRRRCPTVRQLWLELWTASNTGDTICKAAAEACSEM